MTRRSSEECLSIAALIESVLPKDESVTRFTSSHGDPQGFRLSHLAANSTCKNSVPSVGLACSRENVRETSFRFGRLDRITPHSEWAVGASNRCPSSCAMTSASTFLLEQPICDGCIPDATIERMGAVRADRC